jgi:predicted permease
MKRVALALLGGFIIPFVYTIIAAPLSSYVTNKTIDRLLMYPVRWPILIFFRLGFLPFDNEIALFIYIVVCDVVLYSILSYFLLGRFFKPKKRALSLPPEPPSFVRD